MSMHNAIHDDMVLPEENTSNLFHYGRTPLPMYKREPSYTERRGEEVALTAKELHTPAIFVTALRDFFISCIQRAWKIDPLQQVTEQDWHLHLHHSARVLYREQLHYRTVLFHDAVLKKIRGQSAEFCLSNWVRDMIRRFGPHSGVSMPEWVGNEKAIPLGNGFELNPIPPTNGRIFRKGWHTGDILYSKEIDAMVFMNGNKGAMFFDVTTSGLELDKKLDGERETEYGFRIFREKMEKLFRLSDGKKGYQHVSKVHVLSTANSTWASNIVVDEDTDRAVVLKLELAARPIIEQVAEKTLWQLVEMGALHLESGAEYSVRREKLKGLRIAPGTVA